MKYDPDIHHRRSSRLKQYDYKNAGAYYVTICTWKTVGNIVRAFKARCTYTINKIRNTPGVPVWQRNYYERVIRDEYEFNAIRECIVYNPLKWDEDEYNPD